MVQKDLFQYKNLLSFELLEDGLSVKKGGVGRAVAGGILTGFLFMGISRLTEEKIGYGDSLLIIVLGTFLGMWKLLILLLGAFGLAAAVSILLMIKRKFTRKSMIPFVPFLTVAYMGEMLGGMLSGGV